MKLGIDASSLIFLAKINKLEMIIEEYGTIYTTKQVIEEVLFGIQLGHKDALEIKRLVEKEKLQIIVGKEFKFDTNIGIDKGEQSVIVACKNNKINYLIIDDYVGLKVAKYYGLKPFSLPFLFLSLLKKKKLNLDEFKDIINELIEKKYYISTGLYQKIIKKAEEL